MISIFSRLVALILLLLLSPLLIVISLGSFIFQGLPILFKQERVGYKFKAFQLYKFRSMRSDDRKSKITAANDSRVTAWGEILRMTKLDELPQLWNIVKGEMRFIGPRPEVDEFFTLEDFSFLKNIKPGLTDFSSILFRQEASILTNKGGVERYPELLQLKLKLGHLYEQHKSLWLDLELVLLTILSIISARLAANMVKKYFIQGYDPSLITEIDGWLD
ncbi:MAG: sugar transferase [Candidatus Marinimicrobia bacterium]|nr:sugar transferase [Candidatus Neomarinimicrobiota bacterium]